MKIMDTIGFVEDFDKEVGEAMNSELARQRRNLELIASENIVSPAVMAAMGSALTNKYAEGYPGKDTTAAVNVSTLLKILRSKEPVSFSAASLQMFSLIRELRLTLPYILLYAKPGILFSV